MNAAWDDIIDRLEREIITRKADVLSVRQQVDEINATYQKRTLELNRFIDVEVDQIAAAQSLLNHARRQRDGDPLVEALELPVPDDDRHDG